ncbi:hypothetical protein TWF694_001445 [Orbilia ellipsospora]|uniref:Glyoxalase/fosfomycin resistance/dioxygenase domain-containing protein n=1 Tax=Orbilia ellipsospora TaxID=2528407 RepID=A0AAV9XV04_9PEZI
MEEKAQLEASEQHPLLRSARKIIAKFKCLDVRRTALFYVNDLHFKLGGMHTQEDETEPYMASLFIGRHADANIYFFRADNVTDQATTNVVIPKGELMISLGTKQLDDYYNLLKEEGRVNIVDPIEDKPWGYRQFEIEDLDGNKIQFFRFLEGGTPGDDD